MTSLGSSSTGGTTHKQAYDPNAKPLNPEELGIAIRDNISHHREFVRKYQDDPIKGQEWAVVSYQWLEGPLMLPDNELFYGWIKHRGCFATPQDAEEHAKNLLKYDDSKSKNTIIPVGGWTALTSSKLLTKQFHEVSEDEFRKNEEKRRQREAEELKNIREREDKLKKGIEQFAEDSLDYYVVQCVSLSENEHHLDQAMKRVKECRANIDKLSDRLAKLDEQFPEYKDQALAAYNKEREAAGIDPVKAFSYKDR